MIAINNNDFSSVCRLCGSSDIAKIGNIPYLKAIMFSTHNITLEYDPELWECRNCQSWFTNNIIESKIAHDLYRVGHSEEKWNKKDKFEDSKHENITNTLTSLFFPGCKILDIGCNTGELLDFAKKSGCITYGVEFSESSRQIIESKGHYSFTKLEDVVDINFDLIVGFDLIEHLHDVNAFLTKNFILLSKTGKLVLLTGNKNSLSAKLSKNKWWYLKYPEHIVFPSKKYFIKNTDFELESSTETYASRGYETKYYKTLFQVVKSIFRRNYSGLPSIGPDHHLLVLKK